MTRAPPPSSGSGLGHALARADGQAGHSTGSPPIPPPAAILLDLLIAGDGRAFAFLRQLRAPPPAWQRNPGGWLLTAKTLTAKERAELSDIGRREGARQGARKAAISASPKCCAKIVAARQGA